MIVGNGEFKNPIQTLSQLPFVSTVALPTGSVIKFVDAFYNVLNKFQLQPSNLGVIPIDYSSTNNRSWISV